MKCWIDLDWQEVPNDKTIGHREAWKEPQIFYFYFFVFDVVCCVQVMDFGFAFFIVWAVLGADRLELYTTFGRYAFGGVRMCSIRRIFCGKEAKLQVLHLFWSITFFCSVLQCF
jgi:hypothetical protein